MERYKLVLVATILATLLIAGCIGEETTVSALQIKTKALKSISELKTYRFSADIMVEFKMGNETESLTNKTIMKSNGTIDLENKRAYMRTEAEQMNITSSWYIIDNVFYFSMENETTVWLKCNITEFDKIWKRLNMIKFTEELLQISDVERLEDEIIDGTECYVLKLIPDLNKYYALMANQTGSGGAGASNVNVSDLIDGWELKCWISKGTNVVKRIYTFLAINISFFNLSLQESIDMSFYDYNEPVGIVLPEEANNAEWWSNLEESIIEGNLSEIPEKIPIPEE